MKLEVKLPLLTPPGVSANERILFLFVVKAFWKFFEYGSCLLIIDYRLE